MAFELALKRHKGVAGRSFELVSKITHTLLFAARMGGARPPTSASVSPPSTDAAESLSSTSLRLLDALATTTCALRLANVVPRTDCSGVAAAWSMPPRMEAS